MSKRCPASILGRYILSTWKSTDQSVANGLCHKNIYFLHYKRRMCYTCNTMYGYVLPLCSRLKYRNDWGAVRLMLVRCKTEAQLCDEETLSCILVYPMTAIFPNLLLGWDVRGVQKTSTFKFSRCSQKLWFYYLWEAQKYLGWFTGS